jgi:hypothetical protein
MNRSPSPLSSIVCLVISSSSGILIGGVVGFDLGGVIAGFIGGVIGNILGFAFGVVIILVFNSLNDRARLPRPSRSSPVPLPVERSAGRSLRWVCLLLPAAERAAWWADTKSILAEAPNKAERRRAVRSYLHHAPRLIWTSWILRFSASRQRELS